MRIIITFMILIQGIGVLAQSSDKARNAYLKSSQVLWEKVVQVSEDHYRANETDEALFVWVLNEYGLLNATMADKNEALFDKYIDQTEEHLETLEERQYRIAEVQALTSAVAGLKIAYSPWKGMLLGPKSGYLIDEAVSADPESPIVQKLLGNYLLFTPETWGGDVQRAITAYDTAIEGFEKMGLSAHWLYLDALVWKGQALMKQGKKEEAVAALEKVYQLAPEFTWVTEVLLPQARRS